MATGTAPQTVTDWTTVADPTDWQTVDHPLAAAAPTPASAQPEPRTLGNYLKEGAKGVGRGLAGDVKGVGAILAHPQQAAAQFTTQALAAPYLAKSAYDKAPGTTPQRLAAGALAGLENAPVLGPMVQYAERGGSRMASPEAFGAAAEGVTSFEAPAAIGHGVGKLIKAVPDVARAATGTSPKVAGGLAKEVGAENAAAESKAATARGVETQRTGLQQSVYDKSRELQTRIETARQTALKEGNSKYNAVNSKLNPEPADQSAIQNAVAEATSRLKGSDNLPPILKNISARLSQENSVVSGGAKFGPGTPVYESVKAQGGLPSANPFTYKDLQGYYSELGQELSKGTLPGDVYSSLNTLHEAIGEDMQRVADAKGLGPQLTEARAYWRRMKQTFGKPQAPRDAATKTLRSLSPEFAKEDAEGNSVRMLSNYDPEIKGVAKDVTTARKGLKSLPKAQPTTAVKKTIGADEVKSAKLNSLTKRTDAIEHRGAWVATWPLFHIMSSVMRGEIPSVAGTIAESAGTYGAVRGVAGMLRNPKVAEFLTKATPADVAQIPPDLRGQFPAILTQAQKQGIKVAPALVKAFQAGTVVGQTQAK